jgi:cation diffusion facilitator CzcD-associated flavoprotein CzcO
MTIASTADSDAAAAITNGALARNDVVAEPAMTPGKSGGEQAPDHHRVAIVGAGFAGLGAAIRLKQAGIEDFVVLERDSEVGGTWWANTYPGCQCDIPSHLYSFSFAPNPGWTRTYSLQPEIWEYLRRVCREHGVEAHIRFHHEVTAARWDEEARLWRLQIDAGAGNGAPPGAPSRELTAELLIAGPGPLNEPKLPEIEGIDSFRGRIFHSARWDHEHSLRGERVAVIGTGASAIQLVPHIQPQVSKLHVFQRTPPWVVPHRDRRTSRPERLLYRVCPPAQRAVRALTYVSRELFVFTLMHPHAGSLPERAARRHLRKQVPDPELRAKLTPRYRIGCKRTLISNDYYPAVGAPNVELVTDSIAALTPRGIVTADGRERELDTIILGTGFHVTDMPVAEWVHGRGGRTLDDVWRGSPQAYLGTTVAGFPNLFMLVGPNTGLGHNSLVFMIESQLNYAIDCIRHLDRSDAATFEVREDVQRRFNEEVQRRLEGSVWTSGGCVSWYLDAHGRNSTIWPGFTWPFRQRLRHFRAGDYELSPRGGTAPAPPRAATPADAPEPAIAS